MKPFPKISDEFKDLIKRKELEKKKGFNDAILFARSEARSPRAKEFVESCASQLKAKGYLSTKQVEALFRVGSDLYSSNRNFDLYSSNRNFDLTTEYEDGDDCHYRDDEGIPNR
ncbi:hypothetical protein UFOVP903_33 [uncultured Caudovirales phage]|uniref:Uncharacterized protein n=1 Tax=uncultured Caudovirales phage TaxID=2100421 RepID=A0A6J5SAI8_9CAUD|nr:hypothetical protein UFOVP903_33 [uncultured Caudovirales phage]CAB4197385.1 hypothetical protein UFOVP1318_13 [uncultured Caudovirales phage]CAB4210629.1 hypothetical protein UFOVP1430_31 [uncultured Caudovirales phage]